MNPDPNPNPNPNHDNPNNLLDTIILLGYNVRIGCKKIAFYTCFTKEITVKQLFASGSVIMVNIHVDFVSVSIFANNHFDFEE